MNPRAEAPWAKVPLDLITNPKLTLGDIRVFALLDFHAGKRGHWYGPQQQIADELHMGIATVKRAVTKLIELEYIETERLGRDLATTLRYFIVSRTRAQTDELSDSSPVILPDSSPVIPPDSSPVTQPPLTGDTSLPISTEPPQTQTTEGAPAKMAGAPSLGLPPEFQPLQSAEGYRQRNHDRAFESIRLMCEAQQVPVAGIVESFVRDWPSLKVRYGWSDPVAALAKPTVLRIQIDQMSKGVAQSGNGTHTGRPAMVTREELESGELWLNPHFKS